MEKLEAGSWKEEKKKKGEAGRSWKLEKRKEEERGSLLRKTVFGDL